MELVLYNPPQTQNMYGFLIFILIVLSLRTQTNEALKYLPILVKINIMESEAKKQRRLLRKKMKLLSPDKWKQVWLGTFDYMYTRYRIVGSVELRCNDVFSVSENTSWLFNDTSNVKSILAYLMKHRVTEIPSWNDSKITCKITVDDPYLMRHLFIPEDILTDRHSHNIKWEKKLVI